MDSVTAQERLTSVFLMGFCMHLCYFPYEPGLEPDILVRLSMV